MYEGTAKSMMRNDGGKSLAWYRIQSQRSTFIVPCCSKLTCILKAFRSMCGSCPAPFLRHSYRARS